MNNKILKERKIRGMKLLRTLKKLFPGKQRTVLQYSNPLEMLIAVILSAQCTDEQVNKVTEKLFKKYRKLSDYTKVTQKEFEKDIYSTGFYRAKAKNILAMTQMLEGEFNGTVPSSMTEITRLPGVARKTGNVVLGNVYGITEGIAVDTHVKRFAKKFELTDSINPIQIEKDLMEIFPKKEWFTLTYYMITYGREICTARVHDCTRHPLSKIYPRAANIWPKAKK